MSDKGEVCEQEKCKNRDTAGDEQAGPPMCCEKKLDCAAKIKELLALWILMDWDSIDELGRCQENVGGATCEWARSRERPQREEHGVHGEEGEPQRRRGRREDKERLCWWGGVGHNPGAGKSETA